MKTKTLKKWWKRNGLALLSDLDNPKRKDLFWEMQRFQDRFLEGHSLWRTRPPWPSNVLSQWNRQWEYPYAFLNIKESKKGSRILDAGSGLTFFPFFLAQYGFRVSCLDADTRLVDSFPKVNKRLKLNVGFDNGDMLNLPYPSNSFDVIVCLSVLEHLLPSHRKRGVSELFRVLKPKGRLIITLDIDFSRRKEETEKNVILILNSSPKKASFPRIPKKDLISTEFYLKHDPRRLPWYNPEEIAPIRLWRALRMKLRFRNLAILAFCLSKPQADN